MKMKIYIILFLFVAINSVYAQVGIGTTSPNGALEINSSTNGVVVPNVALTSRIIAAPVVNPNGGGVPFSGTLVWNTQTAGTSPNNVVPGFYYWDGATWIAIGGDGGKDWTTTGNGGTSTATNFLGTTDNNDLVFKRNAILAGYLGNPIGATQTTLNVKNTVFGANSLLNPATGFRNTAIGSNVMTGNTSGSRNIAIGDAALSSNTSGIENTAIGVGALFSNSINNSNTAIGRNTLTASTADYNTAVGDRALTANTTGTLNTAIGVNSLYQNTQGNYNTASGVQALRSNTTGNNNTALGYQSFYSNSGGSSNVGLGYQAGYNETGSNKLYIENSNADANNALIYGDFGASPKILRVNGQLQIGNQTTTGYKFPTTRGTNGQTLQTDAVGTVSWTNSLSNLSIMRVRLNANQILNSVGWQKITFDTTTFDTNSEFNSGTNRFTVTKDGYYEINAGIHTYNKSDAEYYGIAVYINNDEYQETSAHHYGDKLISRTINCVANLIAGDYIEIFFYNGNAPTTIDSYYGKNYFEVKQIK